MIGVARKRKKKVTEELGENKFGPSVLNTFNLKDIGFPTVF